MIQIPGCRFLYHRTRGFCLLHGPEELSDRERAFKTVTYLGVEFPVGKLIAIEEALLGVTLGMIPIAIPVRDLFPPDLSPLSTPIAAPLAWVLLALPVAWRNRRAVKTGRWYRLPLRRDRVKRLLLKRLGEDVGPMGSRRGGTITALWRVFNALERERRRPSLC